MANPVTQPMRFERTFRMSPTQHDPIPNALPSVSMPEVDGIKWIVFYGLSAPSRCEDKFLNLSFRCEVEGCEDWFFHTEVTVSYRDPTGNDVMLSEFTHDFRSERYLCSTDISPLEWGQFKNPENGYCTNGIAHITVNITIMFGSKLLQRDFESPSPFTDLALVLENKKLYLNKGVLCDKSLYFDKMLNGNFVEKDNQELTINGFGYEDFLDLLNVAYFNSSELKFSKCQQIMTLNEYFLFKNVKRFIENYADTADWSLRQKLFLSDQCKLYILKVKCLQDCTRADYEKMKAKRFLNQLTKDSRSYLIYKFEADDCSLSTPM